MSLQSTIVRGARLSGIYEVDEPLASGGMGEIYRGHEIRTGAQVAIKLIHSELAGDDDALDLFWREAKALQSIHHEAIVRYFVAAEEPTLGRPYLAMEFITGETLKDVLRTGALALADVMALKARVASGLQAAHRAGVVHRDVTPDNIMVGARDFAHARVIDFGIAKSTKPGEHTVIGKGMAGKLSYMAPEQLGLFDGEVTPRTDVYALGLVLAFACQGKRIDMGGTQVEMIEKRRAIPDLSGVYPEIRPLIVRMLQPDPALRPETMQEVADWTACAPEEDERTLFRSPGGAEKGRPLAPVLQVVQVAPVAETPPRPKKPVKAGGRAFARIGGALVGAAAIGAGVYFAWPSAPPPAKPPTAALAPPLASEPNWAPKPSVAARMLDYVAHADVGGCALLVPTSLTETGAKFDGIGRDAAPFEKFDGAFRAALGIDPDIDVRQVAPPQCPALDFVARLGGGAQPKLTLRVSEIRSGDVLSGDLSAEGANLELLVVDDEGKVYSASSQIKPDNSFAMQLRKAGGGAHPMLLIAIVSPAPLDALRSVRGAAAETFFTSLAQEVAGLSGLGASARYFTID